MAVRAETLWYAAMECGVVSSGMLLWGWFSRGAGHVVRGVGSRAGKEAPDGKDHRVTWGSVAGSRGTVGHVGWSRGVVGQGHVGQLVTWGSHVG
eukprot:1133221-Rhodomonas_salina.1